MSEPQVEQQQLAEENVDYSSKCFIMQAMFKGHTESVTSLHVNFDHTLLASGSRDKTALIWTLSKTQDRWAKEDTRLVGHNHFVSDVSFSMDASHLLTASWDGTLRLWELKSRTLKSIFKGHEKDVLACTFSNDNRRIFSASRDLTFRLWNIKGEERSKFKEQSWVTAITCAPFEAEESPLFCAIGTWDGSVKITKVFEKVEEVSHFQKAHEGRVTGVKYSPDGEFLISSGSDRKIRLWDIKTKEPTITFTNASSVNAIAICPSKPWICAACYDGIAIWALDQPTASQKVDVIQPSFPSGKRHKGRNPEAMSLCWSEDGTVLYAGYSNGEIRAWKMKLDAQ